MVAEQLEDRSHWLHILSEDCVEMEAALAEMENSPHMTAEQKAQMRAMMEGAMGAMQSASNAPAADIEAVRPHVEALRQLGEE